ncbi:hypothetical protein [Streptacidiphilus sp. EB103A]|uniref:hypothetical protein n=1 Tax=Streptacidiphilus sp. EB103A TaxID=3156275 RepID=UPI0035116E0D
MSTRDPRRFLAGILHKSFTAQTTDNLLTAYSDQVLAQAAPQHTVLAEIAAERARQDQTFGEQNHPDGTGSLTQIFNMDNIRAGVERAAAEGRQVWANVLGEEVAEVLAESDPTALRVELVQVAAVAVAWIEAIDRRQAAGQVPLPDWDTVPYAVEGFAPTAQQIAAVRAARLPGHDAPGTYLTAGMVNQAINHLRAIARVSVSTPGERSAT